MQQVIEVGLRHAAAAAAFAFPGQKENVARLLNLAETERRRVVVQRRSAIQLANAVQLELDPGRAKADTTQISSK